VIGGVIGHQLGNSSRGRDHGTAAGAVVGGLIGNQVERDQQGPSAQREIEIERRPVERSVERCRTVQELREATTGWDVVYEYGGREFMTRMQSDPGRFLRVRVDVAPVEELPPPRRERRPAPPTYR
jgi:uncharacterized protein YcfJ